MASSKRRPNKQKRYRQNRQERAARAARSKHAGEATAISEGLAERKVEPTPSTRTADAKPAPAARRRRQSPYTIPGQRAVVMSLMLAIVSAGTLLFFPISVERQVEPDDPRVEKAEPEVGEDGLVSIREDAKLVDEEPAPIVAGVIGLPIVICGVAVAYTKRPRRSTAWTMAMIALSAYIFLFAGPYGVIALPSLIALAVGGFQSRRAENKERMAEIRAERAAREAAADEDDGHREGGSVDDDDG